MMLAPILGAGRAYAQQTSRIGFCLNLAQTVQESAYVQTRNYLTREDDLRRELMSACTGFRYETITKAGGGFRVIAEGDGEIWSIDEKKNLVRIAGEKNSLASTETFSPFGVATKSKGRQAQVQSVKASDKELAALRAQGAPAAPSATAASAPVKRTQVNEPAIAVAAAPASGKSPIFGVADEDDSSGEPIPRPFTVDPNTKITPERSAKDDATPPPDKAVRAGQEVSSDGMNLTRMTQCFNRKHYHSETCQSLFNELHRQCGKDDVPLVRLCLELEAAIGDVNLAACVNNDVDFGKCELRKVQLEKRCSNQLRQPSAECRGLARYLASATPPSVDASKATPAMFGGAGAVKFPADATPRSLGSTLRTLIRLRPVIYESKSNPRFKEMGFISQEVEMVNSALMNYKSGGEPEGVKYTQFAALLTSGMQEMYGMCRENLDFQRDIINRASTLEQDNSALRRENEAMQKQLSALTEEVKAIKESLLRKK